MILQELQNTLGIFLYIGHLYQHLSLSLLQEKQPESVRSLKAPQLSCGFEGQEQP